MDQTAALPPDAPPQTESWHSQVLAPWHVADVDDVPWDQTADVVVVGFGGAGAATALRSAEHGLQVSVLERAVGGGATEASGGVVYAGGGTRVQVECGEQDTPQNMFEYLKLETQGVVADQTLMRFCEQSPAMVDWLMNHGVKFSGPVFKRKTSYPNVEYFLYHSDNSLLPDYSQHATPAARGHRGMMKRGRSAVNLGGAVFWPLRDACAKQGVSLLQHTEARQLIVDRDGRVIGVRALQFVPGSAELAAFLDHKERGEKLRTRYPFFLPGARWFQARARRHFEAAERLEHEQRRWVCIRARRGVCLAGGGFIFNRDMVAHHCPEFAGGMPLGTPGDDGSAIRLGESVGGATRHMDRATAWRFINPPLSWSRGALVDQRGARFVNECTYGATIGEAMVRNAEGRCWLVLDRQLVQRAWREIWPSKVLPFQWQLGALNMLFAKSVCATPEDAASKFGFDAPTLRETLAQVKRVAEGETEDPFGRAAADTHAIEGPLHIFDASLTARLFPCTVLTMGGLAVDEATGRVLKSGENDGGAVIPGLYAAGRTAVGIPSWLYMSGLSISDGIFSGLRAADDLANRR